MVIPGRRKEIGALPARPVPACEAPDPMVIPGRCRVRPIPEGRGPDRARAGT